MKKLFTLVAAVMAAVCANAGEVDITERFTYTWQDAESLTTNDDGSITYEAVQWGGMVAWIGGENWSGYSKVVFEYAEATTVNTQILVGGTDAKAWGNVGITKLECSFADIDMTDVQQIALQTSDAVTLTVTRVYLVEVSSEEPVEPSENVAIDLGSGWGTWNGADKYTLNEDGTLTYEAASWGGLSLWLDDADWSDYKTLVYEFAEETPCATQPFVQYAGADGSDVNETNWTAAGVTKISIDLNADLKGHVKQFALQAAEATTLVITAIYLVKDSTVGIDAVQTVGQRGTRYNLAGQKVDAQYRGVVIENGRKFFQK